MQAPLAKDITVGETGALENPVRGVDGPVRRTGHDALLGASHPQQVGLRFVVHVQPAFLVDLGHITGTPALGTVADRDRRIVQEFDRAVQAIAAQVHQLATPLKHPFLQAVVHLLGPVLRVRADDENLVGIQVELLKMKLGFGIQVVPESLALQPAKQPPFGR